MLRFLVPAFLAVGAVAAAGASAQEVLRVRSETHMFAPETAAAHVVTLDRGQSQSTITRLGNWIREDSTVRGQRGEPDRQVVTFTDVAAGRSFFIHRDDVGVRSLLIRGPESSGFYASTRERTGDTGTGLGEPCAIWNMVTTTRNSYFPPEREQQCITNDGIMLWARRQDRASGQFVQGATAVSLERRQVAADYVRPPSELFNWGYWTRIAGDTNPTSAASDYEVRLEADDRRQARITRRIIRQHRQWTYTENAYGNGGRSFEIRNDKLSLSYSTGIEGTSPSLQIRVASESEMASAAARAAAVAAAYAPVPLPQPTQREVGQRCRWFHMTPGLHDAYTNWCRTEDGIPLRIVEGGQTGGQSFKATRMSRRRLFDSDIAPPRAVFDWPR
jgi:hypothetical protein